MPIPDPQPGMVIRYSYLWHDEARHGQEEGIKDRPCVIVSARPDTGVGAGIIVTPITHSPPRHATEAVEIPAATKKRLGLDAAPSWIIVSEANRFVWPGHDLRLVPQGGFAYGFLPPKLFRQVRDGLLICARTKITIRTS